MPQFIWLPWASCWHLFAHLLVTGWVTVMLLTGLVVVLPGPLASFSEHTRLFSCSHCWLLCCFSWCHDYKLLQRVIWLDSGPFEGMAPWGQCLKFFCLRIGSSQLLSHLSVAPQSAWYLHLQWIWPSPPSDLVAKGHLAEGQIQPLALSSEGFGGCSCIIRVCISW